jgi:hypothetical protein
MLRLETLYIEIVGGNGARMYVKTSGKPVFDSDGEFRGYRGAGLDSHHARAPGA